MRGIPCLDEFDVHEATLSTLLSHGIAYYHESLCSFDKEVVRNLFQDGRLQVVIVSRSSMWEWSCPAPFVVVFGTHTYEGKEDLLNIKFPIYFSCLENPKGTIY
jgi:replicative superfamily II helicase